MINLKKILFSNQKILELKNKIYQILNTKIIQIQDAINIVPTNNCLYKYTVKENDIINFNFEDLKNNQMITFKMQLHITSYLDFQIKNVVWINQTTFKENTVYYIVFRYDKENFTGEILYNYNDIQT